MITLTLKETPSVPLEAETITPDAFAGLELDAVRGLPVQLGNRQYRIDEFFDVAGEPGEHIEIRGDASRVKWIGRNMTRGTITVVGNAGMHLGAFMKGGAIHVTGNAGDWIGAEMLQGLIRVDGNAGGQIGGAYRGSVTGMRDGTILVGGNAGLEVGTRMRRGIIAVKGRVRDFAGLQMKGGTIVLLGGAEIRTGAWMVRGTIISLTPIRLLPTFLYACQYTPTYLGIYAKYLEKHGFNLPAGGVYKRYSGDSSLPGKGEILIWQGN